MNSILNTLLLGLFAVFQIVVIVKLSTIALMKSEAARRAQADDIAMQQYRASRG